MQSIPAVSALHHVVDSAMHIDDAVCGDAHVFDPSQAALVLVAWRGFDERTVACMALVPTTSALACAQAFGDGRRVVIRNVDDDDGLAPFRAIAAACGWRAVQATPLKGIDGQNLGTLGTYFADSHHPSAASLRKLDGCTQVAALLVQCTKMRDRLEAAGRYVMLTGAAARASQALRVLLPMLGERYDQMLLEATANQLRLVIRQLDCQA